MVLCLHCRESVPSLLRVENKVTVAARCPFCTLIADKYVEQDYVSLCIDLALLYRQAWTHVAFNLRFAEVVKPLLTCVLVTCLLESYVALMLRSWEDGVGSPATCDADFAAPRSLRIVETVAKDNKVGLAPLFTLFAYSIVEFLLVGVCTTWAISVGRSGIPTVSLLVGYGLTSGAKLLFGLFCVWEMPLYLLGLVDFASVLLVFVSTRSLLSEGGTPQGPVTRPVCVAVLALCMKALFRGLTGWCPPSMLQADEVLMSFGL